MEQFSSERRYFRRAIYLVNKKRWSMHWIVSTVENGRLPSGVSRWHWPFYVGHCAFNFNDVKSNAGLLFGFGIVLAVKFIANKIPVMMRGDIS